MTSRYRNRPTHYKPRTPTKRAVLDALNANRPLEMEPMELRKPKRRDWKTEDNLEGINEMAETVTIEKRKLEVLKQNSRDLSSVITATHPLFRSVWDVVGDDDAATVTMKYEDWEHLLFIMKPFHPREVEKLERLMFPKKDGIGGTDDTRTD